MPSLSVNNSNNRFTLTLTVTETATSVANNTSTVTWSLDLKANTAYNFSTYAIGYSVALNGVTVGYQSRADRIQYSIADYGTLHLAGGSGVVLNHADDGSLVMPVSFSIDMASADYTPGAMSSSGTMTLTKLARYSTLTVPNGTLGTAQTITVVQQSTNHTHTIKWVCGTAGGTIATESSATSFTFTPDISLAAQNTAGTSVVITFTITTTGVGDRQTTATYAIPASVKPSVSLSVYDAAGYLSTYGADVQGWSKLAITATPTLAYSSPIASYAIMADGKTYTSSPVTTDVVQNVGTLSLAAKVTDARTRPSDVATTSITVLEYAKPTVTVTAYRCNSSGTADSEGAYMKLGFTATISSLNGKNAATYTIKYRKGADAATTLTGNGTTYTSDAIACDVSQVWTVEVTVADKLSSTTQSGVIPIAFTLMDFYSSGKGVAFGKVAIRDGFDCAMAAHFTGETELPSSVVIGGKTLLNLIYPLGSIYMSVNNVSPATFLGGTWAQINDRFLLAAGSTYSAGSTGGSATHTLTTAEMPSHTHNAAIAGGSEAYGTTRTAVGNFSRVTSGYTDSSTLLSTGSGAAHNNMPPYLTVYVWKRTA